MRFLFVAALCSGLAAPAVQAADYYTLAVTLPPAFCALHPERAHSEECRQPQALGVHGLWPESQSGRSPSDCDRGTPVISPPLRRRLEVVMPDSGLQSPAWRSHGSCSGMPAETFFNTLLDRYGRLHWPAMLTSVQGRDKVVERRLLLDAIRAANPGMPERALYLRCEGHERPPLLTEVRICINDAGGFTECGRTFRPNCPTALTIKAR
jgi:ribonuclease T2